MNADQRQTGGFRTWVWIVAAQKWQPWTDIRALAYAEAMQAGSRARGRYYTCIAIEKIITFECGA